MAAGCRRDRVHGCCQGRVSSETTLYLDTLTHDDGPAEDEGGLHLTLGGSTLRNGRKRPEAPPPHETRDLPRAHSVVSSPLFHLSSFGTAHKHKHKLPRALAPRCSTGT